MPIYAYKCSRCGHAQDLLRKISDPPLSTCPACGADTFVKQVTAAGFQLKGSGWYVTDFREGNKGAAKPDAKPDEKVGEKARENAGDKPAEAAKPADAAPAPAASAASAPAPAAPAAAPAPSGR
jgi:putative FmdB family regulatory protein